MSHGPECTFCSSRPGWLMPLYVRVKGAITGAKRYRVVGYACQICARGALREHRKDTDAPVYSSPKRADIPPEIKAAAGQSGSA